MRFYCYATAVFLLSLFGGGSAVFAQPEGKEVAAPSAEMLALDQELAQAQTDTSRIRILLALQEAAYSYTYTYQLKSYSQLLLSLLSSKSPPELFFQAHYHLALSEWRIKSYDSAFYHIYLCDSFSRFLGPSFSFKAKHLMGVIYAALDKQEEAEKTLEQVIEMGKSMGPFEQNLVLHAYNVLGNQSAVHGQLFKASTYYLGMLEAAEGMENKEPLLSGSINLAGIYLDLALPDQVFGYADEALCLASVNLDYKRMARAHHLQAEAWALLDSLQLARRYADKALAFALKLPKEHTLHASMYHLLGKYEQATGNFEKALSLQNTALEELKKPYGRIIHLSDWETLANIRLALNEVYREKKLPHLALIQLDSAFLIAKKLENAQMLAAIHRGYARSYVKVNNFEEAYQHEVLATEMDKQNHALKNHHLIEQMQLKYTSLKKDQLITQLEAKNLKEEAKRSQSINERNYLIISFLFSVFLFSIFIYFLQQKRKKENIIGRQQLELQKLRIDDLLNEQATHNLSAMLDGQEKERKRIALELHDRMGSLLAMVKLHVEEDSKQSLELVDQAILEIRRISHNLASGTLMDFGLITALAELKKMVEVNGKVIFELNTFKIDRRFPSHIETNLYRIIQELVNNSLKHADPDKITLSITRREDAISMIYEDNGRGFDLERAQKEAGLGLWNIYQRVSKIQGNWHLNTQIGKGMEAILEIPLQEEQNL